MSIEKKKVLIALGVVSGRITLDDLCWEDWHLLGFDPNKDHHVWNWHKGKPEKNEVLLACEKIMFLFILGDL